MNVRRIHDYTVPWNLAVAFFALSAVVASWAAYDPEAARAKLAILFIGIALYYAVVLLRGNGRTVLVEALAYGAGLLSIWFLLSHNWEVGGVDFEWIGRVGVGLTQLQLEGLQLGMHPNRAAGILAMMIPLQVATVALTHARAAWPRFGGAVLATLVSLFGLVMTSSRGAWVALGISTVILASLFMGRRVLLRFNWARKPLARWGIAMIAVVFLGIVLFCAPWSFMLEQLAAVPGETSIPDRLQLYRQAFEIAREVPIAGGGLASFAGLYSQYILVIPVYFLGYSHNLYLDVFLEQGLLGMAARGGTPGGGSRLKDPCMGSFGRGDHLSPAWPCGRPALWGAGNTIALLAPRPSGRSCRLGASSWSPNRISMAREYRRSKYGESRAGRMACRGMAR